MKAMKAIMTAIMTAIMSAFAYNERHQHRRSGGGVGVVLGAPSARARQVAGRNVHHARDPHDRICHDTMPPYDRICHATMTPYTGPTSCPLHGTALHGTAPHRAEEALHGGASASRRHAASTITRMPCLLVVSSHYDFSTRFGEIWLPPLVVTYLSLFEAPRCARGCRS